MISTHQARTDELTRSVTNGSRLFNPHDQSVISNAMYSSTIDDCKHFLVNIMTSTQNQKPVLLVFGSQALNIDAAAVSRIHEAAASSGHGWLLDNVSNLPADYTTAISQLPILRATQTTLDGSDVGLSQLRQLSLLIKTGQPLTESTSLSFPLPNKILIPLVVVAQLAQYDEFLTRTCTGYAPEPSELCHRALQTLGCCTGLLGAFVASCSRNETQFRIYSAAAIRLGMLIGSE